MARWVYPKKTCPVCGLLLSTSGAVWSSHMRKHEREGLVIEEEEWVVRYTYRLTPAGRRVRRDRLKAGQEPDGGA